MQIEQIFDVELTIHLWMACSFICWSIFLEPFLLSPLCISWLCCFCFDLQFNWLLHLAPKSFTCLTGYHLFLKEFIEAKSHSSVSKVVSVTFWVIFWHQHLLSSSLASLCVWFLAYLHGFTFSFYCSLVHQSNMILCLVFLLHLCNASFLYLA